MKPPIPGRHSTCKGRKETRVPAWKLVDRGAGPYLLATARSDQSKGQAGSCDSCGALGLRSAAAGTNRVDG